MTAAVGPAPPRSGASDGTLVPLALEGGFTPQLEQLEMYARDVRSLHEQRATLAEELRRVERKLVSAQAEPARLRARLEREYERARALEARLRRRPAAGLPPDHVARRDARRAVVGVVATTLALALLGALALFLVGRLAAGPEQSGVAAAASERPATGGAPAPDLPIVASSESPPASTPTAEPGPAAVSRLPAPPSVQANPGPSPTPAVPARCAGDLAIPALAPKVAYVTLVKQARTDKVTVVWPGVGGRIAVAAAGPISASVRVPAMVPLAQVPPSLLQRAAAGPELTATVPAGDVFVVLSNDTGARLPQSHGVVFYAGTSSCG